MGTWQVMSEYCRSVDSPYYMTFSSLSMASTLSQQICGLPPSAGMVKGAPSAASSMYRFPYALGLEVQLLWSGLWLIPYIGIPLSSNQSTASCNSLPLLIVHKIIKCPFASNLFRIRSAPKSLPTSGYSCVTTVPSKSTQIYIPIPSLQKPLVPAISVTMLLNKFRV